MTDKPLMYTRLIAAVCISMLATTPAMANEASQFLASLEGEYAGRGEAQLLGESADRIACRINNSFDASVNTLSLSGECASTKGKDAVQGRIVANGSGINGSFVSPRDSVEVTQSSGSYNNGEMILSASFFDKRVQKLTKVRQIVSRTDSGITAQFMTFDNKSGSYQPTGQINLKKR